MSREDQEVTEKLLQLRGNLNWVLRAPAYRQVVAVECDDELLPLSGIALLSEYTPPICRIAEITSSIGLPL